MSDRTFRDTLLSVLPRWLLGTGGIKFTPGSDESTIVTSDAAIPATADTGDPAADDLPPTPGGPGSVELEGLNGYRVLTCLGAVNDLVGAAYIEQGLKACWPGQGDDYALALQGEQRGIVRGLQESSAAYARRLWYFRQARMRKGLVFPLGEQLQAMLQPYPVVIDIVANDGGLGAPATRYTLSAGAYAYNGDYLSAPPGTVTIGKTPTAWNWGGSLWPTSFWVVIHAHPWLRDGVWSDAGLWDDLDTVDGTSATPILDPLASDYVPTYGSTASQASVNAVLSVAADWTPPHARLEAVILAFDGAFPEPTSGDWNQPGNRDPNFVYWRGH